MRHPRVSSYRWRIVASPLTGQEDGGRVSGFVSRSGPGSTPFVGSEEGAPVGTFYVYPESSSISLGPQVDREEMGEMDPTPFPVSWKQGRLPVDLPENRGLRPNDRVGRDFPVTGLWLRPRVPFLVWLLSKGSP